MGLPAKQAQFVEFAKRDGKSRDIANSIDELTINVSRVADKPTFDGVITVSSQPGSGYGYIAQADIPTADGIYKGTDNSLFLVRLGSGSTIYMTRIIGNVVTVSASGTTTTGDIWLEGSNREFYEPFGTKLYKHHITAGQGWDIYAYSTCPDAVTNLNNLFNSVNYWSYISSAVYQGNVKVVVNYSKNTLYYFNTSDLTTLASESITTCTDSVTAI